MPEILYNFPATTYEGSAGRDPNFFVLDRETINTRKLGEGIVLSEGYNTSEKDKAYVLDVTFESNGQKYSSYTYWETWEDEEGERRCGPPICELYVAGEPVFGYNSNSLYRPEQVGNCLPVEHGVEVTAAFINELPGVEAAITAEYKALIDSKSWDLLKRLRYEKVDLGEDGMWTVERVASDGTSMGEPWTEDMNTFLRVVVERALYRVPEIVKFKVDEELGTLSEHQSLNAGIYTAIAENLGPDIEASINTAARKIASAK